MTFSIRRVLIATSIVLIVGAISIAGVFLATFDLNNFRFDVAESISSRISQPVDLGQAHFSLKHGPSFVFENIRIGSKGTPLHLTAEHVFFRLDALPLLAGRFRFSEILFEAPDLTLKIGRADASVEEGDQHILVDQSLFSGDLLQSIRIKNGHFKIEDYRTSGSPFVFALENVRLLIDDLSLRKSGWIEAQADIVCNDIRSPFMLSGYIRTGASTPVWSHANYDLEMHLRDFATDILTQRYSRFFKRLQIEGRSDIHLQVSGSPSDGLTFNADLSGRDLGIRLAGIRQVVPAGHISAAGRWRTIGQLQKLDNLQLDFGTMNFSGSGSIDFSAADPIVTASVSAPRLALTDFNRFFSEANGRESGNDPTPFNAGTFSLSTLRFSGPASSLASRDILSLVTTLELAVRSGAVTMPGGMKLEDIDFDLTWNGRDLAIENLALNVPRFHITSDAELLLLREKEPERIAVTGQNRLKIRPRFTESRQSEPFLPENGLSAVAHLDAVFQNGVWTFNNNLLALPSIKAIVQARWDSRQEQGFLVDLAVPEFSLADLPLVSPSLSKMHPEGLAAAQCRIEGVPDGPTRFHAEINLNGVHLKTVGPLADLDRLQGTFRLDWPKLRGSGLTASLGESPISLDLDIPDLRIPKVDLAIRGKSIRADELIFRSENTFLRDVDAQLSITDKALLLGPIHTRMDGGTDVVINGIIDNFPIADTRLSIEGPYGNIDEVIGLWISETDRQQARHRKRERGQLEIDIKTSAGEIAQLPFAETEAHISYRNRSLVIYPISFKSGPGFGLGQVVIVYRDDLPPLLKISGHLEEFDALAVYQQLLQRNGIVTGKLRGDFYLEGTAGALKNVFLPSSMGAFHFEVRDGVLKKLKGLSKTLTVFNIYPLFTSSDSSKGVPFDVLKGDVVLDKGVLSSDNMFMKGDVMNMSMTGSQNLVDGTVDIELGVMPLRTIDRLVTKIPLAGWILTGENKALVTAHFKLTGPAEDPKVTPIPIESASKQVIGIFERVLKLPVKVINDVGKSIE